MPRSRRGNSAKTRRGSRLGSKCDSQTSDDDAASEVLSHYSSTSEIASVAEEGIGSETGDELSAQEESEYRLKESIDDILDKSAKIRQKALEDLKMAFSSNTLFEFLIDRRYTLTESLERCLKKGKGEEQALAATVATLMCLQFGSGPEGEETFKALQPHLMVLLSDDSASLVARQSCATALGMCCYMAADDIEDVISCMTCLESIFISRYNKGDDIVPSRIPAVQLLHCNALRSWTLLLTICPLSRIEKILETHLPKLPSMFSSDNVSIRMATGEALALLFELARDIDDEFFYEDIDLLCTVLKEMATDSNKYRAKTDRRKQRSLFRDVLHFIENGECPEETIKFGFECIYVDSWERRKTYNAFKETLGSGIWHHLQNNIHLRDIFNLGSPLVLDAATIKASKISHFDKHLYNSAAFKARTKARNKVRDKRADVL